VKESGKQLVQVALLAAFAVVVGASFLADISVGRQMAGRSARRCWR